MRRVRHLSRVHVAACAIPAILVAWAIYAAIEELLR